MRTLLRKRRPGGFTLIELLVVIIIVILVSAVVLPSVIPALSNRQVSEAARILHASLAGARDAAIRNNAPRGIRLIPDTTLSDFKTGQRLTFNRFIAIEPAPDITEGFATFPSPLQPGATPPLPGATWSNASGFPPYYNFPAASTTTYYPVLPAPGVGVNQVLIVEQAVYANNVPPIPNPPTSWFWNVRIGDKFRFGDSGRYYTVIGPMTVPNPEFFVNDGVPGATSSLVEAYDTTTGTQVTANPEFLFLVNGVDDDNDGYTDNGMDGIDNNQKNGIDDITEWLDPSIPSVAEVETWLGAQAQESQSLIAPPGTTLSVRQVLKYAISRRPVPSPGANEVALPSSIVIDATTWDTTHERSRLPVDPNSFTVDILVNQNGQVVPTTAYSNPGSYSMGASFYQFWLCDRTDVYTPVPPPAAVPGKVIPTLPMPDGTFDSKGNSYMTYLGTYNPNLATTILKKDRQLVTLFSRSGQIVTNSIEHFLVDNIDTPYLEAQLGIREAK